SYLRLTVSDTGMGIPANIIDKIFEPFFTTKKVGEGTGLGLSVVHGIVTTHDGSIIVKSEPGKGTNVEIYFPVIEDAAQPEEASDTIDALPRGKERILVVDDEQPLIEMLQHVFGHLGYEVVGINGSVEALALFRRDPMRFDLVITDLTMPDMTGAELAKELLTVRPDIPVIIFTGCGQTLTEDQIKDLGVRAMITKPISMKDIAVVIRKILEKILDEGGVGCA
ncbi:MAG: response regulator, partial [Deltaproteobacteria bacterium]|nr:response regulator [Deltaproteobacteria bacterium]